MLEIEIELMLVEVGVVVFVVFEGLKIKEEEESYSLHSRRSGTAEGSFQKRKVVQFTLDFYDIESRTREPSAKIG